MNDFKSTIDKQIGFNQGKNIFFKDLNNFQFTENTIKTISKAETLSPDFFHSLVDYATDKAIEEFCRINQYYSLGSKARNELREIYTELIECIQAKSYPVEDIAKNHYRKLQQWIIENNSFAKSVNKDNDQQADIITCSQYNPDLQINILRIDVNRLNQPVLDIGCGKDSLLVNYLAKNSIDIIGIDRYKFNSPKLLTIDWLEYDYGKNKWGTIVSNLGFSNHFQHHNLRVDGNYIEYAKTYMNILEALKVGGQFHYAPDLPFVEKYLDTKKYEINKYNINGLNYKATVIKRLE